MFTHKCQKWNVNKIMKMNSTRDKIPNKNLLPFSNRCKTSNKIENAAFSITFFFHIAQCSKHIYCLA